MKYLLFVLLLVYSITTQAATHLAAQSHDVVQEKVFLHIDNNCYFTSDTIWYKAYAVRADNHYPTDISRILYVELLNEQGYLVERQQLLMGEDGQAHGQFALADSLWTGYYEIRAYTKWMRNFGDECAFSRVVPIYEKYNEQSDYPSKAMPVKVTAGDYTIEYPLPKCNIRFYPEGGHLVYGLASRVAFEVQNEQTKRINASGVLMEDGQMIQTLQCNNDGRGIFSFVPKKGSKYQTQWVVNHQTYYEEFPQIEDVGYTLRVDRTNSHLDITIHCNEDALIAKPIHLTVSCRGKTYATHPVTFTQDRYCLLSLDTDSFPAGVNMVTLYAEQALASRLFFIPPTEKALVKAKITGTTKNLQPYERQVWDISLSPQATHQSFSIAVRDKLQMDESYDKRNIITELLLQSELRGFIENIDKYFHDSEALDLLMMIQGWSRYDWHPSALVYEMEKSPSISGQMFDVNTRLWQQTKGKKALFASLFLKDDNVYDEHIHENTYHFKGAMFADSLGRFRIEYTPFTGNGILQLSGFYADKLGKKRYGKFVHDTHIFIKTEDFFMKHPKQYSWYEVNEPLWRNTFDQETDTAAIMLNEVFVQSKKRRFRKRGDLQPVITYSFNDFLNEYWDHATYNSDYLFTNQNYDIQNIIVYLQQKMLRYYTGNNAHVGVMFNGNYIHPTNEQYTDIMKRYSFLHKIDSLKIITDLPCRPTYYRLSYPTRWIPVGTTSPIDIPMSQVGFVNFQTFPNDEERFVEGRYITLHGFHQPAEFYSPDYSKIPMPEKTDYRRTLFWNPSITTDETGRTHIEFYNNKVCTEVDVEIEGITATGLFIVNEP